MLTAQIWLILGAILMLAELVIPGFLVFFFGVGALCVGVLKLLFPLPVWAELTIYLLISVGTLLAFRKYMPHCFRGSQKVQDLPEEDLEFSGEIAKVTEEIQPPREGKIFFHGSTWNAKADEAIAVGEQVVIKRRENITFLVEKDK